MVGDGDAVRVAGQILEHATRSTEGRFHVHHPIQAGGLIAQSLEASGFSEWFQLAVKLQSAVAKRAAQPAQKAFSKTMTEQAHWEKEAGFFAADPA